MYYVVQENLFREYGYQALIDHLVRKREKLGTLAIDFEVVKYIPFSGTLDVKTPRKDVFFFGYSGAGKIGMEKYGWKPGVFFNENFTMEKYLPAFGEHMLNSDGKILHVTHEILLQGDYFFRPVGDGKEFTGQVMNAKDWYKYVEGNDSLSDLTFMIASPKRTQQEIRCWMIDGEPVTISQYKIGSRGNYLNMDHNEEAILFARKMAKIYQPARAYCLDICLYNDEYYIVELGCINHCAFYDANMGRLIDSLEKMTF